MASPMPELMARIELKMPHTDVTLSAELPLDDGLVKAVHSVTFDWGEEYPVHPDWDNGGDGGVELDAPEVEVGNCVRILPSEDGIISARSDHLGWVTEIDNRFKYPVAVTFTDGGRVCFGYREVEVWPR